MWEFVEQIRRFTDDRCDEMREGVISLPSMQSGGVLHGIIGHDELCKGSVFSDEELCPI